MFSVQSVDLVLFNIDSRLKITITNGFVALEYLTSLLCLSTKCINNDSY